jgi:hypothetical protein
VPGVTSAALPQDSEVPRAATIFLFAMIIYLS